MERNAAANLGDFINEGAMFTSNRITWSETHRLSLGGQWHLVIVDLGVVEETPACGILCIETSTII